MSDQPLDDERAAEELMAEMARRLAETPVPDLVLHTAATFADLAGVRLGYGPQGREHRDLAQARLAIEGLRALLGVIESELGAETARPLREPLATLQLLYAREVEADARAEAGEPGDEGGGGEEGGGIWTPGQGEGGEGRLWTPPGSDR
jgi:hypothetical protein